MRAITTAALMLIVLGPLPAAAGQGYSVCRDANGKPFFTDQGCPEDTVNQGRGYAAGGQTYSGEESIDTGTLNNYEGRYGTGRSWNWRPAPAGR